MKHCHAFSTFFTMLQLELVSPSTALNANYLLHTHLYPFRSRPPLTPILPVTAHTVLLSLASFHRNPPSILHSLLFLVPSAKYLGSYVTPTSSSNPHVNYGCSQASAAFKQLDPFFPHPLISQKFKLRVYSQSIQSILLPGCESQVYSPAQITKIDSLQYKAVKQIFHIKSPSDSPCSNEYLLSLAYPVLPTCIPSSMRISDSRLRNLGHILRHPGSLESLIIFNNSFSLRTYFLSSWCS